MLWIMDSRYGLNKAYMSYSALSLWLKSRAEYRKQYYEQRPRFESPELLFGKQMATLLENNDPSVAQVKRYQKAEHKLSVDIDGVPFFGFIDSYCPLTHSFLEYKTGTVPWTDKRVQTHLQLDLYSLGIELQEGSVAEECSLIWLQTRRVTTPAQGLVSHADDHQIELTGEIMTFPRVITSTDRENAKELLVRVAHEIEDDYKMYR